MALFRRWPFSSFESFASCERSKTGAGTHCGPATASMAVALRAAQARCPNWPDAWAGWSEHRPDLRRDAAAFERESLRGADVSSLKVFFSGTAICSLKAAWCGKSGAASSCQARRMRVFVFKSLHNYHYGTLINSTAQPGEILRAAFCALKWIARSRPMRRGLPPRRL